MKYQYDEHHILNRLYIYWDISTQCNLDCEYCYARNKYIPLKQWNKRDLWLNQLLVLKSLSLSKYPIYLGFHGGEPTLHPYFLKLVELTLKQLNKQLDQLYITTNGSINKIFDLIYKENLFSKYKHKLRFLFSYHPYSKYKNDFINNVEKINKLGFKTKVNVLLVENKDYWCDIKDVYLQCNKITKAHPHFIYDTDKNHNEILREYSNDFYEYFNFLDFSKCYYKFEDNKNKYKISDYQLFKNNLNHFKGWQCFNNNYEILWNGVLMKICDNKKIDLIKNPLYFNKLNIKPMICPYDNCDSDGVLKCLKINLNQ